MATLKSRGLWDTDEEEEALKLKSSVAAKTSKHTGSKPSIFDSDEDDQLFAPKPTKVSKVSNLFDEEDETNHEVAKIDYKQLYESEILKSKHLESVVANLELEIATLRLQLTQHSQQLNSDTHEPENTNNIVVSSRDAEWEALAREEKLRRQRAIQQKASRHRSVNISKRVGGVSSVHESDEVRASVDTVESSELTSERAAVPAKGVQVGHYLDSDDNAEEDVLSTHPSTLTTHTTPIQTLIDAEPHTIPVVPSVIVQKQTEPVVQTPPVVHTVPEVEKEVAAEEDPEVVKWRELAAQDKARKALARRSVRVVRRGASSGSMGGSVGGGSGVGGSMGGVVSSVGGAGGIKSSGSLQNLTTSITNTTHNANTNTNNTTTNTTSRVSPTVDSDWDSSSSSDGEGSSVVYSGSRGGSVVHTPVVSVYNSRSVSPLPPLPRNTTHTSTSNNASNTTHTNNNNTTHTSTTTNNTTNNTTTNNTNTTTTTTDITPEEETALDRRLRTWAAGRSTVQLLCSIHTIIHAAVFVVYEGSDVVVAAQMLNSVVQCNGQPTAGDVRKAYMRVIRACHPDKHMQLPPRGAAFLELQKVFTILSDSYNRYKAALPS